MADSEENEEIPEDDRKTSVFQRLKFWKRRQNWDQEIADTESAMDDPVTQKSEELTEENLSAEEPLKKSKGGRRFSFRVLLFRVVVYGFFAFAFLLFFTWAAVTLLVEPDDVLSLIKDNVEEQTGGRLDIKSVEFNVLTGMTLSGVQFYPPKMNDTRGYLNGGAVEPIPLADLEKMTLVYSIPRAFAGRLHLKQAQLISPQFHLRRHDGVWNFDSIAAFRAEHFHEDFEDFSDDSPSVDEDSGSTAKEAELAEKSDEEKPSSEIVPLSPALLFLPFDIMAHNIGVTNLRLDMIEHNRGQISTVLMTSGLTMDMGLFWRGLESSVWFSTISTFEQPFEVDLKQASVDDFGKVTGPLVDKLTLKSAISQRFELSDLNKIKVDLALRLMRIETELAGYDDLGIFVNTKLAFEENYKKIVFELLDVDIADTFSYDMHGDVTIENDTFESFDIGLTQSFVLDLAGVNNLAKPFVSGLYTDGKINLENLRIEGDLNTKQLAERFAPEEADAALAKATDSTYDKPLKTLKLPFVSGAVLLQEVSMAYPDQGVKIDPIAGSVTIAAGPSLTGQGSTVDITTDLDMPGIEAKRKTDLGSIQVNIVNMDTKMTARVLWPEMIAPVFKLSVEAEHVKASGSEIQPVDAPLYIDIDADGGQDLKRLGMTASFELSDLAEFSSTIDCSDACSRFRTNVSGRFESLKNLHAIALPLSGMFGAGAFMPSKLDGNIDFQFNARGKIPNPLETPPENILREGDVRFNGQFNLSKLSTEVPFMDVKLVDLNNRLIVGGSLEEQKLEIVNGFESLSVTLPGDEPKIAKIDRFSFDLNVDNSIDGPINLADPIKQLITDVRTRVFIGKVNAAGILPDPMSDLRFGVEVSQKNLKHIHLKEATANIPDFGVATKVAASAVINEKFMPESVSTDMSLSINHSGGEKLPMGISSSGKFDVNIKVATNDLKTVEVDGVTKFEKFNVKIPSAKEGKPPLLIVEGINGEVPFGQRVDITPFLKSEEEKLAEEQSKKDQVQPTEEEDKFLAVVDDYLDRNEDKLLKTTNVVTIVDYPTVRPFYKNKKPLSIERVEVANLEVSKMEFDIELKQNWFKINQFVMNFLGGKIQGDFQLAFNPMPKSMRTSVHMTKLDTREMIKKFPNLQGETSSWSVFSNPYLGGTVHLKNDFVTGDMEGGVEITSIGKEQLKMMLFYVDPYEQDPMISELRMYLNLGEVRQVSIPIKNGEIGLDVDVRALSVPLPTPKLSKIPISQMIKTFLDKSTDSEVPESKDESVEKVDAPISGA